MGRTFLGVRGSDWYRVITRLPLEPEAQNTHTHQRHYKIGNPFEWMEMIRLQGKMNFFEKRVGEYSKSGVGVDKADQIFTLDTSF
jgi:hypothetical protein